jgi:hypothetical protein
MYKIIFYLAGLFMLVTVGSIHAAPRPGDVAPGDNWQANPFDFTFGNHIDTHVQLKLKNKMGNPDSISGSFYIIFTDDQGVSLGTDAASGLPIARHPRGTSEDHDETCGVSPNIVCVVGWHMDGAPGAAKFISHDGVNGDDHPLWMVNRTEEDTAPETGMVIPQPGSFTHHHWITTTSTDPRAASVSAECDKQKAGQLQDQEPTAVDSVCQGWFLQIQAVREFAFKHGGESIPIRLGMDNRSHLNLLTNFNNDVVITSIRGGGGGH